MPTPRLLATFAFAFLASFAFVGPSSVVADDPSDDTSETTNDGAIDPGHSSHGETFNEGPRQAAVVLPGMAAITFATSATSPEAQAFIEQGIAQLHGFWFLEAERSFRQAAFLQPDLAIAYWGCAMANLENRSRAIGFIDKAVERLIDSTPRREKLYVEALDHFLKAKPKDDATNEEKDTAKRNAHERYLADLEKIIDEFPGDIEAKSLLVLSLYRANEEGVKIQSYYAINAILDDIFEIQPLHPAHHYRIHLWDHRRSENALDSAAKSGPSMPGIAHMWHMPGHTYSSLNRYADAVWQQEASARVDHAAMTRSRVMPDQIHNFSHNNEWMVRNLIYLGRADGAVRHSKNLIDLPRHPKYNTYNKGSFRFGSDRLLQTLSSFNRWDEMISLTQGRYLGVTGDNEADDETKLWTAVAYFMTKKTVEGAKCLRELKRKSLAVQSRLLDAEERTESDPPIDADKLNGELKRLRKQIARASAADAASRGDKEAFAEHTKTADLDTVLHAQWLAMAGDLDGAKTMAEKAVDSGHGQVRPLAVLADILWRQGNRDEALKQFEKLRTVAHSADLETPLLVALKPLIDEAKIEGDWRIAMEPAGDLGERPELSTLGPEAWQPPAAASFVVRSHTDDEIQSTSWDGKPRLVIFYLGFGCLHCVEQLKAFGPHIEAFKEAGIDVIGISSEDTATLAKGIAAFEESIAVPLFSDPDASAFKAYRCWDDFESVALHGTFLIDAAGHVRWQDIGPEPFVDVEFLLNESKRLLSPGE